MYDILVKNGRVVDGSGNPWYKADVAVKAGKIAAIAACIEGEATRVVDAEGRVVTPGVVDIHSHTDRTIFSNPRAESAVKQGITTTAVGQCGGSAAPHAAPRQGEAWSDFGTFMNDVENHGLGINIAPCVGHGTVRGYVMGPEGKGGEHPTPTATELEQMKAEVVKAMCHGCFGLTTGLQYPVGRNASTSEVVELMWAARPGIYMTHMREQAAKIVDGVKEAIEVTEQAGCRGVIAHLKMAGSKQWGFSERILGIIEDARSRGVDILFDVYPWRYSGVGLLHRDILPPWVHQNGIPAMLSSLRRREVRDRIKADIATGIPGWTNSAKLRGWDNATVVYSTDETAQDLNLEELADLRGQNPVDVVCDLVICDEATTRACHNTMSEEDVRALLAHPLAMVSTDSTAYDGEPKGSVHPRYLGSYPRLFGYYVREQRLLTLEDAVRKCSAAPALALGLDGRGILRPGAWADLLVFDPDIVDYPGTFADPVHSPVGIDIVVVNGHVAVQSGVHTGNLAGAVLRRPV